MSHDPDRHVMEKAYARWAPIYEALELKRQDCRDFALGMTWAESARIFLKHVDAARVGKRQAA